MIVYYYALFLLKECKTFLGSKSAERYILRLFLDRSTGLNEVFREVMGVSLALSLAAANLG